MSGRIALCMDELTYAKPALIGLDGESLETQDWLEVFVDGETARASIAERLEFSEAWVASCDQVEPINLAATLKRDRPDLCVRLVEFNGCGSLYSRAHTAGIDEVMERSSFVRRYGEAKMGAARQAAGYVGAPLAKARADMSRPVPNGSTSASEGEANLVKTDSPDVAPGAVGAVESGKAAGGAVRTNAPSVAGRNVFAENGREARDPAGEPPVSPLISLARSGLLAPQRTAGFIFPIVSGSGGAGKSTVAVTSAFMASRMGYRTLLLDCDLQFGDSAVLAGVAEPLAVDVALSHPERLEQELMRNDNPTVLGAPSRLESADAAAHGLPALIDGLSGAFDVIIANTGAAWADYHAMLLERSSAALFLVDQRASSIWACRHALELCARCGIATGPFQFAVNRCGKAAPLSAIDVSSALQGQVVYEIEDGGADVEEYLGAGAVADLLDTNNPFCESLERLLKQILPGGSLRSLEKVEPPAGKRLAKRRGRHAGHKWGWGS